MNRFSSISHRYGPVLLLWLAAVTQGAKSPAQFFLWGSTALVIVAIEIANRPHAFLGRDHPKEILLLALIILSQLNSQNFAQSLPWTGEAIVFLLLWMTFKATPDFWTNQESLYFHIGLISVWILVQTFMQYNRDWIHAWGIFPYNPAFNAAWLTSAGIAYLSRTLNRKMEWAYFGWPVFEGILMVFLLMAVLLGPSRSALLGLGIALLYVLSPFWNIRRVALALLLLALATEFIPGSLLYQRLHLWQENYRPEIWSVAWRGSLDHALLGWGLGNFDMLYQRYAFPVMTDVVRFARATNFAHNEYLQVAAELGWIPFYLILGAIGVVLAKSAAPSKLTKRPAKAAFISLTAAAVTNFIWHLPIILFLTIVWAAILLHRASPAKEESLPRFRLLLFLGLFFIEGTLGWNAIRYRWAQKENWTAITRFNPWDATAWKNKGDRESQWQEAVQAYERAIALAPADSSFHSALGHALEASNLLEYFPPAIQHYEEALRLAPGSAPNALATGRTYFKLQKFSDALAWFEKAREMEPRYWESDLWLARCWVMLGKPDKAVWTLRSLKDRHAYFENILGKLDLQTLPSYERTILSYDREIVRKELQYAESRKADHVQ